MNKKKADNHDVQDKGNPADTQRHTMLIFGYVLAVMLGDQNSV